MGVSPVDPRFAVSQLYGANPTGNLPAGHPTLIRFGNYQPRGHTGMDFACPIDTPVYATEDGVVTWADWGTKLPGDNSHAGWASRYYLAKQSLGIGVVLEHTARGGYVSVYAHLQRTHLNPGDRVKRGQVIGTAQTGRIGGTGNTGLSTGPHLHFEIIPTSYQWTNGMYGRVDPRPYITDRLVLDPAIPAPPAPPISPAPGSPALRYERPLSSRAWTAPANCLRVFGFARPAMPVSDVIHHWDDPARNPTLRGTVNYLAGQPTNGVSAHYVGEAGTVVQMVDERNASHANGHGAANAMTVTHEWNPRCSPEDREALAEHLATCWISRGRTTPGIVEMHRTYLATACPGRYEQHLPAIRTRAAELFHAKRAGTVTPQGSPSGQPARAVVLQGVPAYSHRLGQKHHHTVRPGDTLWAISQHFGAPVATIARWNGIRNNVIHPGQRLRVR